MGSVDVGLSKVGGESKMGNRHLRMKRGAFRLATLTPYGSTVKKASQKVVEGFY